MGGAASGTGSDSTYRERLWVPVRWWLLGLGFLFSIWVAIIVAAPGKLATIITAIAFLALAAAFLLYGGATIQVDAGSLRAGSATIPRRFLGTVTPLDRAQTRALLGVGADARAYLLTRPYLSRSVRIELHDPADPTPYWVLGTRRPQRLAAALGSGSEVRRPG